MVSEVKAVSGVGMFRFFQRIVLPVFLNSRERTASIARLRAMFNIQVNKRPLQDHNDGTRSPNAQKVSCRISSERFLHAHNNAMYHTV